MIGIITVFHSENCGSVLQAYALSKVIEELGYEVKFISTKNKYSSHSLIRTILSTINKLIRLDFINAKSIIIRYNNFQKMIKYFDAIKAQLIKKLRFDAIIIGSDTVWDVNSLYFNESKKLFWPTDIFNVPLIVYGASVANSKVEDMIKKKYPLKCLEIINNISVRDNYSFTVISALTNKSIQLVCDPTLLAPKTIYKRFEKKIVINNYLLLYLFEELEFELVQEIKEFAKNNNLFIISFMKYLNWCDKFVDSSIENFITYFANASYVITNTYHGVLFSIIYNKNFLCVGNKKNKIVDFLSYLKLSHHIITNRIQFYQIDYYSINEQIKELKNRSYNYLFNSLIQSLISRD